MPHSIQARTNSAAVNRTYLPAPRGPRTASSTVCRVPLLLSNVFTSTAQEQWHTRHPGMSPTHARKATADLRAIRTVLDAVAGFLRIVGRVVPLPA